MHVLGAAVDAGDQACDGLANLLYLVPALNGESIGLTGLITGNRGAAGNILYRRTHFVNGGGDLISLSLLHYHAVAHTGHGLGQSAGTLIQFQCRLAYRADDGLLGLLHGIEGSGHRADFIARTARRTQCQVTGAFHCQHDVAQGDDMAGDEQNQQLREEQHHQHQRCHHDRIEWRAFK